MKIIGISNYNNDYVSDVLRKVAGNEFLSSRGLVVNPVKISCALQNLWLNFYKFIKIYIKDER